MIGKKPIRPIIQEITPSAEEVQKELRTAKSMVNFFGKDGNFSRLFTKTLEQTLEAELSKRLGYEPYEVKDRNSDNSCNGSYPKIGYIPDFFSINNIGYEIDNGWQFYSHPAPFIHQVGTQIIHAVENLLRTRFTEDWKLWML